MDEDVVGRDVAVDETQRLPVAAGEIVRVLQAAGGHRDDLADLRDRQVLAPLGRQLVDRAQRRPVDELHRDEVVPVGLAEVEDGDDVRMVEPRRQPRLVEEHLDELLVAREVGKDALQTHHLLEACRAGLLGEIDLGHATAGDELDQPVLAERRRHPVRAYTQGDTSNNAVLQKRSGIPRLRRGAAIWRAA